MASGMQKVLKNFKLSASTLIIQYGIDALLTIPGTYDNTDVAEITY